MVLVSLSFCSRSVTFSTWYPCCRSRAIFRLIRGIPSKDHSISPALGFIRRAEYWLKANVVVEHT